MAKNFGAINLLLNNNSQQKEPSSGFTILFIEKILELGKSESVLLKAAGAGDRGCGGAVTVHLKEDETLTQRFAGTTNKLFFMTLTAGIKGVGCQFVI